MAQRVHHPVTEEEVVDLARKEAATLVRKGEDLAQVLAEVTVLHHAVEWVKDHTEVAHKAVQEAVRKA